MKKAVLVLAALILVLGGALAARAEEEIYNSLVDIYQKAVAAEEQVSEEQALVLYAQLADFYDGQDRRNQRYRDAAYYYAYAQGRLCFSRGEYADAMEWFGDLTRGGQTDEGWLHLLFYRAFSQGMYCLGEGDVETALPLLIEAEQQNADAVGLCEEQIDVCAELLEKQIDSACAQGDYDLADHYCDLYDDYISKVSARALRRQVQQARQNNSLRWVQITPAQTQIDLVWAGGTGPYTVYWADDMLTCSCQVEGQQLTINGLVPGTAYQLTVRAEGGAEETLQTGASTTPAPDFLLGDGQRVVCSNVTLRAYDVNHYYRQRRVSASYTLAREYRGSSSAATGISLNAGQATLLVFATNQSAESLAALEGLPYTLILRLEGAEPVFEEGAVGDALCDVNGNMLLVSLEGAMTSLRERLPLVEGTHRATVTLLVQGCLLATAAGATVP